MNGSGEIDGAATESVTASRRSRRAKSTRDAKPAADSEPAAVSGERPDDGPATTATTARVATLAAQQQPHPRRRALRRGVGPLIGDGLAEGLLEAHPADVLLADRCRCGQPFPCDTWRFAASFVSDESYQPADRAGGVVRAGTDRRPVPRHAEPSPRRGGPRENSPGRDSTTSRRDSAASSPAEAGPRHAELDPDATQQLPKIPADGQQIPLAV